MGSSLAPNGAPHPDPAASAPCVTIDKGMPLPKKKCSSGRPIGLAGAAARDLQVGESFAWPAPRGEGVARTQMHAIGVLRNLRPKKFATRTVIEGGKALIRVWRTA